MSNCCSSTQCSNYVRHSELSSQPSACLRCRSSAATIHESVHRSVRQTARDGFSANAVARSGAGGEVVARRGAFFLLLPPLKWRSRGGVQACPAACKTTQMPAVPRPARWESFSGRSCILGSSASRASRFVANLLAAQCHARHKVLETRARALIWRSSACRERPILPAHPAWLNSQVQWWRRVRR